MTARAGTCRHATCCPDPVHRDDPRAAARNIALMFQSYALYPHLTVYQNIAMPLSLRRLSVLERLPGMPLLHAPVRHVATFVGNNRMNVLPMGPADALHSPGARFDLGVRPEDLRLTRDGPIVATVETTAHHGEESVISLRAAGDLTLRAVLRGAEPPPEPGSRVRLSAALQTLHAFDVTGQRVEIAGCCAAASPIWSSWDPRPLRWCCSFSCRWRS